MKREGDTQERKPFTLNFHNLGVGRWGGDRGHFSLLSSGEGKNPRNFLLISGDGGRGTVPQFYTSLRA